jgi:Fungal N-terminal domain of STAND proteins
MADPLSIAAAVTGITVAAIKSAQKLLQFIEAIQEAPVAIANIREDLQAVDAILRSLNKALQGPQLSDELKTSIENGTLQSAVQSCQDLCIKKVTVSGKSGLLVGIINGEESNINQNIEDVSASDDSFGVVGIGRNIDTTEFFRRFRQ